MSLFIIYAIVVTLGLLLYYAVQIAIDVRTFDKKATTQEETISAGADTEEEEAPHTPKSVVEDPETGGFTFSLPNESTSSSPTEAIEEEAEPVPSEEESPTPKAEVLPTPTDVPSEATEEESEQNQPAEELESNEGEENPASDVESESMEEDDCGLTIIRYKEDEPQQEDVKPIDVSQAFDPSLTQPKFGVSAMIGEPGSPQTKQKANDVNANTESIKVRGNLLSHAELLAIMQNQELVKAYNIETRNEVCRC